MRGKEKTEQVEPAIPGNEAPKKKKRKPLIILLTVLAVIVLIIISLMVVSRVTAPEPEISDFTLSANAVDDGESVEVNVACTNPSLWKQEASFPVYLNDELVFENEMQIEPEATLNSTFTLEALESGHYKVGVSDQTLPLTVRTPAKFEVSFEPDQNPIVTGVEIPIYYRVENVGESKGVASIEVKADGKTVDTAEYTIDGKSAFKYDATLVLEDADQDTVEVAVNEITEEFAVYTPEKLKNAETLMKTSVKGYGYFILTNESESDRIVYITDSEDYSKALAAVCVTAGNEVKLYSFPHGTYHLFVQTGENWIPELNKFATNRRIRRLDEDLVFENNVDKVMGGWYTYWTIGLSDDFLSSAYFQDADSIPEIQE